MNTRHTMLASAVALLLSTAAMAAPQSSGGAMGGTPGGSASGSSASGSSGSSSSSMRDSGSSSSSSSSSAQLGAADRKFIADAASAGMFEVQAAQLAQTKAQDSQNKTYAQQMISDHEKNNRQLMQIAQSKGVSPPTRLDAKHQALLSKLQKADGAEFDKQYGRIMDQSHKEAVDLFERGEKAVKDTELKSYISQTLPTLHQHHQQAASLPGGKGSSSRSAEAGSYSEKPGSTGGMTSGSSRGSMGGSSDSMGGASSGSSRGSTSGSSTSGSMGGSTTGGSSSMGSSTSGDTSSSDTTSGSSTRPGASSGNPDTSNPPKP
jgi:putative membrane protein